MAVAACGRIVTLPKTGTSGTGVPAGNMYIRFRTLNPLNFAKYYYVVVFNTNGNGQTPYAATFATYINYSFALVFGGTGISGASYQLLQVISTGSSAGYTTRQIAITPQFITNFNANSDGTGNEFTFTFNRFLLLTVTNPTTSASPSPLPTTSPNSGPTISPGTSTLWAMNFFTTDLSFNPIDAIATLGTQDTSFNSYVVDTTAAFDVVVTKPLPAQYPPTDPATEIIQTEVINSP
jgi:hypothetical protein